MRLSDSYDVIPSVMSCCFLPIISTILSSFFNTNNQEIQPIFSSKFYDDKNDEDIKLYWKYYIKIRTIHA